MNKSSSTGEIIKNRNKKNIKGPKVFLNGVLIQNSFHKKGKEKENSNIKNLKTPLNSTTNKSNKSNNHTKTFSFEINPEIDNEINDLYKQYYQSKNSRKQFENNYNQLSNKLNLLKKRRKRNKRKTKYYLIKNIEKKRKNSISKFRRKRIFN